MKVQSLEWWRRTCGVVAGFFTVWLVVAGVARPAHAAVPNRFAILWTPADLTDRIRRVFCDRLSNGRPNPDSVFQIPDANCFDLKGGALASPLKGPVTPSLEGLVARAAPQIEAVAHPEVFIVVSALGRDSKILDGNGSEVTFPRLLRGLFGTFDNAAPLGPSEATIHFFADFFGAANLQTPLEFCTSGESRCRYSKVNLYASSQDRPVFPNQVWDYFSGIESFLKRVSFLGKVKPEQVLNPLNFERWVGSNDTSVWSTDPWDWLNFPVLIDAPHLLDIALNEKERSSDRAQAVRALVPHASSLTRNGLRKLQSLLEKGRMAAGPMDRAKIGSSRQMLFGHQMIDENRALGAAVITSLAELKGISAFDAIQPDFEEYLRWAVSRAMDSDLVAAAAWALIEINPEKYSTLILDALPTIGGIAHWEFVLQSLSAANAPIVTTMLDRLLNTSDLGARRTRVRELGKLCFYRGDSCTAQLRFNYKNADDLGQIDIIEILGDARLPNSSPFLRGLLTVGSPERRAWAARALSRLGHGARQSVDEIAKLVESHGEEPRRLAVEALGQIADPSSIGVLAEALANDESSKVRLAALRALVRIRTPVIMPALERAENDNDPQISALARNAVRGLKEFYDGMTKK